MPLHGQTVFTLRSCERRWDFQYLALMYTKEGTAGNLIKSDNPLRS